jgi:hypothetical protein
MFTNFFKRERTSAMCQRLRVPNILICGTNRKQVNCVHCTVGLHITVSAKVQSEGGYREGRQAGRQAGGDARDKNQS